jgi:hypothetical protein
MIALTQIAGFKTHIWPADVSLLVLPFDCDRPLVAFEESSLRVGDCGIHVAFPRRRGRPKIHANATERKRASRAKKKQWRNVETQSRGPEEPFTLDEQNPDRPMPNTVTGGYDSKKIAEVDAAHEGDTGRVTPSSHGPAGNRDFNNYEDVEVDEAEAHRDALEREDTFLLKHVKDLRFDPEPLGTDALNESCPKILCTLHSFIKSWGNPALIGECQGIFIVPERDERGRPKKNLVIVPGEISYDAGGSNWITLIPAHKKRGTETLEMLCGCVRNNVTKVKTIIKARPNY